MKGIILAGGTGSRLFPLTKVTNKHLLPVGREPMIFHPVRKLIEAGIDEILIVTGVEHMGDVVNLLGSGKDFGCRFTYKVQDEAGGIAQALGLAENFAGKKPALRDPRRQHLRGLHRALREGLCQAGARRAPLAQAGARPAALRRGGDRRRARRAHRGEAEEAQERPRGGGHLLLRRAGVRHHPHAQAQRARRAGDHRREQPLPDAPAPCSTTGSRAGGRTRAPSSRSRWRTSW